MVKHLLEMSAFIISRLLRSQKSKYEAVSTNKVRSSQPNKQKMLKNGNEHLKRGHQRHKVENADLNSKEAGINARLV